MRLLPIAILAAGLAGCGGGDSESGGSGGGVVFSVDPVKGPTCANTDDVDEYRSGDYQTYGCKWYCAPHFDGRSNVYVSITFENSRFTDGRWVLDRKFLSDGIC